MTPAQSKLRELREKQSKQRGSMAELAQVDELCDEQRSELDTIEKGTPDLERQIRAATVALEDEEKEAETRAANEPDAEQRERQALRRKASLTAYLRAALSGGQVDGAEAELRSTAGVNGIPLELWDVPAETEQRAATEAPGTTGVNLDRIRPQVFANSIAPRLGIEMPRVMSGTMRPRPLQRPWRPLRKARGGRRRDGCDVYSDGRNAEADIGAAVGPGGGRGRCRTSQFRVDPSRKSVAGFER